MKWGRSNEMKESFNCVTRPQATSCGKLSRSSAGMTWRTGRRTMLLQMMVYRTVAVVLSVPRSVFAQVQTPPKYISHTQTRAKSAFHTSNKPGYQKTIDVTLSSAILQKLASVQMSAAPSKTKPSTDTDSCHPLSMAAENKAQSEMPPRDFLEELIYSI